MTYEEREKVYREAIDRYGVNHQIGVAVEELLELGKELQKYANRGVDTRKQITEEMADVAVAMEQLQLIFKNGEDLATVAYEKVKRLEDNMRNEKPRRRIVLKVVRR